jgi:hypothetical protein
MKISKYFLSVLAVCSFLSSYGQVILREGSPEYRRWKNDSFYLYYNVNGNEIDRIDRLHKPLNIEEACMIPYRNGKKFGFVSKDGKILLIEPRFDQVYEVTNKGAIVSIDGGYGFVDSTGEVMAPLVYHNMFQVQGLYHGLLSDVWDKNDSTIPDKFKNFNLNTYIDENLYFLFQEKSHDQRLFNEVDTVAWFRYGKTYTIRGLSGKVWKKFRIDEGPKFLGITNNLLLFSEELDSHYSVRAVDVHDSIHFTISAVNPKGPLKYSQFFYKLNNNLFAVQGGYSNLELSFIDSTAQKVLYKWHLPFSAYTFELLKLMESEFEGPEKDALYSFLQGNSMTVFTENKKYGVLDDEGNILVPFAYKYLGQEQEGLIPFIDSSKFGIIGFLNRKNEVVIEPSFNPDNSRRRDVGGIPLGFSGGLCAIKKWIPMDTNTNVDSLRNLKVTVNTGWRKDSLGRQIKTCNREGFVYIDKKGKDVIEMDADVAFAGPFHDGLAPVIKRKKGLGFIDKKGNIVIPFEYYPDYVGGYPIVFMVVPKFINGFAYLKNLKGYIDKSGKEYFEGEKLSDKYMFSH